MFPLFAQLSQPASPKGPNKDIDYSPDPKLTVQVLGLLRDMLGSTTNQQEMIRYRGFAVVAYLLQQAPPNCYDTEALSVLNELFNMPNMPATMKEDIISSLILDFRLWVSF